MPTLAESVINSGLQQSQNFGSQTVGDALNAYHIASTAEHANQELQMEKQNQEINKANYVMQNIDKISRMSGKPQQIMIDSFKDRLKQIMPGYDPRAIDMLTQDDNSLADTAMVVGKLMNVGIDHNQAQSLLSKLHSVDGATEILEKAGQFRAMTTQALIRNQGQQGRVEAMNDAMTDRMKKEFDDNPNMQKLLNVGQPLGRDVYNIQQAEKEGKPVTYQMLAEAIQSTSNALAPGSGVSDFRVKEISPNVSDKMITAIKTAATDNPNQEAAPEYKKYVKDTLTRTYNATRADVAQTSDRIYSGMSPDIFHNQNAVEMAKRKHAYYRSGQALQPPDVSGLSGGASDQNAPKYAPDVTAYAAKYGITPDAAQQIKDSYQGQ